MNLDKIKFWIGSLGKKSLVRNTLWMLLAQGLRLILQAVYFVIIARALGAEQYGAFIGAYSFVAIIAPFASLGAGHLLIKNVSRNRLLMGEYWGNALLMVFVSGSALIVCIMFIAPILLAKTIPLSLVFLVAVSELIFTRISEISSQAFQSVLWLSKSARLNILPNLTRLMAAIALVKLFPNPDALKWTVFYLASTASCALLGVLLVHRDLGPPKLALSRIKPEIKEGFYFAVSLSAQNIYGDIDKTMLARFSSLSATGIYAAAYRLIDVALAPVRSLVYAAYAKFFQHGEAGIGGSIGLAKRLSTIAGIYGIAVGIALFLLAPVLHYLLGAEYTDAVEALRWLAPLPFFKALNEFAADTLTGAGFQGLRSAVQVIIALFNVLINLWLIPMYSWRGATWSSLASDGFLMLGLWMMVTFLYWQHQGVKGNKEK